MATNYLFSVPLVKTYMTEGGRLNKNKPVIYQFSIF